MIRYFYMGAEIPKGLFDNLSELNVPLKRTLYSKDDKELKPGVCRICGCTVDDPCWHPQYGACSWADEEETLCSWCCKGVLTRKEKEITMHRANTVNREMINGLDNQD